MPPLIYFDREKILKELITSRRKYHFQFYLSSSIFRTSRTDLISRLLFDTYDMDINKINQNDLNEIVKKINKKIEKVELSIFTTSEEDKITINETDSGKFNVGIW